ncbi:endonuclease domain-containing protein [Amycolatopsis sp. CA-230715]|uniref:endonuclease domain-containing protein n=1 Tax=Amycolatopsis sp. CA-230715 TaxID=2745196 RepID=UPI001C0202B7|nr:DUF559 domain-containing protein [Amycolatopsis sp. CA-230715]QWF81468.1 hypothetical protein HUW46_04900 [Amycolatopsis sp. CA-230715]
MGLITAGQLRGPAVRRLFQDAYARADVEVTHELRCRAAALIVPAQAVLTGRSAATVHGVALANPYDPVEFVVPEKHRFGPIAGIKVRRTAVTPTESRPWQGIRIARPARVALDLLLRLSPRMRGWVRRLRQGVPDLDAYLRSGRVGTRALETLFRRRRNRGIRLAREALELSDARAESLPESEVRVVLRAGGYQPTAQLVVRSRRRRFRARLDLALEEDKVAIEYDGAWHNTPAQRAHDRRRRERLEEDGWTIIVITAEDLAGDHNRILERVDRAMRRDTAERQSSESSSFHV